jgi:branched-chain amino acid transport system ATP-binding protein
VEIAVSVLLETQGLVKQFGEFRAVDGVDFRVQEGEVLALIGSNGAGKTTLVNLISGLLRADAGRIVFQGADVTAQSVHERIAAGIARSFQLVNLFDQLSALDNVALAIFSRQKKTRKLWALAEADRPVWQEALEILATFRMDAKAGVLAGGLSQGERKLLDVAIAYALKPKLLFLDEPTSGVSTREKSPIMDTISSVVRSEGISAAIIEHDMDVVFAYSDRIVAMHQGTILADGTPDEIRRDERVLTTLIGTPETRWAWRGRCSSWTASRPIAVPLKYYARCRCRSPAARRCAWSVATAPGRRRPSTRSWAFCRRAAARCGSRGARSRGSPRTSARGSASATRRRTAESFRISRWRRTFRSPPGSARRPRPRSSASFRRSRRSSAGAASICPAGRRRCSPSPARSR